MPDPSADRVDVRAILCPVDFSEASRGALRYAGAIAESLGSELIVSTVNDPLLQEAARLAAGGDHLVEDTRRELERFVRNTFETEARPPALRFEVAVGAPAEEILRHAREIPCDLIVMSSLGLTGFRKMFFGSTTERVLRETPVPVLVIPAGDHGPIDVKRMREAVRRVVVPVEPAGSADRVLHIVRGISATLNASVLLVHVVEPLRAIVGAQRLPGIEQERRARAESRIEALAGGIAWPSAPEALVAYGEPAEELAKIARDRDAGLIVMGLHTSPLLAPRVGSVTYRVLCLAHTLVLAVPPGLTAAAT